MDEMSSSPPSEEALRLGHQPDYFRVRPVLIAGCCFALLMVAVVTGMWLLEWGLTWRFGVVPLEQWPRRERPQAGPSIDSNQPRELAELRRAERVILTSYAWQNESGRIARIPIDRAMAELAERGMPAALPGYPTLSPDEAVPSAPVPEEGQQANPEESGPARPPAGDPGSAEATNEPPDRPDNDSQQQSVPQE